MKGGLTQSRLPNEMVDYSQTLEDAVLVAASNSTVSLPAGVLNLSRKIAVKNQVILQGAGSRRTIIQSRYNGLNDYSAITEHNHIIFNETALYDVLLSPRFDVDDTDPADPTKLSRRLMSQVSEGGTTCQIKKLSGDSYTTGQYYVVVGAERAIHLTDTDNSDPEATQVEVLRLASVVDGGSTFTLTFQAPDVNPNPGADTPYISGTTWTAVQAGVFGTDFTTTTNPANCGKIIRTVPEDIRSGYGLKGVTLLGQTISEFDPNSAVLKPLPGNNKVQLVSFTGCIGPVLEDVVLSGFRVGAVTFACCRNVRVDRLSIKGAKALPSDGAGGYGVLMYYTRGAFVGNLYVYDVREAVDATKATYDLLVRNLVAVPFSPGTLDGSYDQLACIMDCGHGQNARRLTYSQIDAGYSTCNIANPYWRLGVKGVELVDARVQRIFIYCNADGIALTRTTVDGNKITWNAGGTFQTLTAEVKVHGFDDLQGTLEARGVGGFVNNLVVRGSFFRGNKFGGVLFSAPYDYTGVPGIPTNTLNTFGTIDIAESSGAGAVGSQIINLGVDANGNAISGSRAIKLGTTSVSVALKLGFSGATKVTSLTCPNGDYHIELSGTSGSSFSLAIFKTTLEGPTLVVPHINLSTTTKGILSGNTNLANFTAGQNVFTPNVPNADWTGSCAFADL